MASRSRLFRNDWIAGCQFFQPSENTLCIVVALRLNHFLQEVEMYYQEISAYKIECIFYIRIRESGLGLIYELRGPNICEFCRDLEAIDNRVCL